MAERTITISGYSETFSMTDWRIGQAIASPQWTELIGAMNDLLYVCAPAPLQYGVTAGIRELDHNFYQDVQNPFRSSVIDFVRCLIGRA